MDQKLCLKPGQTVKFKGLFNSYAEENLIMFLSLIDCNENTSYICKPESERREQIQTLLDINPYIVMEFFILTMTLNPQKKNPINYKL